MQTFAFGYDILHKHTSIYFINEHFYHKYPHVYFTTYENREKWIKWKVFPKWSRLTEYDKDNS